MLSVAALLLLAGCMGGMGSSKNALKRAINESRYYNLVLHPPQLAWDEANQTLSGSVTLSAIPPLYHQSFPTEVDASRLLVQITYYSMPPEQRPGGFSKYWSHSFDHPTNQFDFTLTPGETLVFNFTNRPYYPIQQQIRGIAFDLIYGYTAIEDLESGATNTELFSVSYDNRCIGVVNGKLQQSYASNLCSQGARPELSSHRMTLNGRAIPPVETWNTWTDIWPTLVPVRDFLNNFTHENVRYFRGEVLGADVNYFVE